MIGGNAAHRQSRRITLYLASGEAAVLASAIMQIHVHAGAHKTATTYLQETLALNINRLNQAGIGYLPLTAFRSRITDKLDGLAKRQAHIDEFLPLFFPSAPVPSNGRIILSDENLVGNCLQITSLGAPLTTGPARLKHLRSMLAGHEVTLFFAVRSYDTFIASAYCEALRALPEFLAFPAVKAKLKTASFDWPSLIASFRESLSPQAVKIWRFEDFRQNSEKVTRDLAFGYDGPLEAPGRSSIRPSFSQQSMDMLHGLARTVGAGVATQMLKSLTTSLPKEIGKSDYYPWSASEGASWRKKYHEDCNRIDASFWLLPREGGPLSA